MTGTANAADWVRVFPARALWYIGALLALMLAAAAHPAFLIAATAFTVFGVAGMIGEQIRGYKKARTAG